MHIPNIIIIFAEILEHMNNLTLNGKDIHYIDIDVKPMTWSPSTINGMYDSDVRTRMPFSDNGRWKVSIDVTTGKVLGWPDVTARIRYRVEDDFEIGYRDILDSINRRAVKIPAFLKEIGSDNVIRLNISNTGHILGWSVSQTDIDESLR